MPAVSKSQQRFFGMVRNAQKGGKAVSKEVSRAASSTSSADASDFASTKHKGLQEKKAAIRRCANLVTNFNMLKLAAGGAGTSSKGLSGPVGGGGGSESGAGALGMGGVSGGSSLPSSTIKRKNVKHRKRAGEMMDDARLTKLANLVTNYELLKESAGGLNIRAVKREKTSAAGSIADALLIGGGDIGGGDGRSPPPKDISPASVKGRSPRNAGKSSLGRLIRRRTVKREKISLDKAAKGGLEPPPSIPGGSNTVGRPSVKAAATPSGICIASPAAQGSIQAMLSKLRQGKKAT